MFLKMYGTDGEILIFGFLVARNFLSNLTQNFTIHFNEYFRSTFVI